MNQLHWITRLMSWQTGFYFVLFWLNSLMYYKTYCYFHKENIWLTYITASVAIKLLKFKFITLFSIIYTWSPTGHPEYIFPLVLTSATQELFGCRADEDVTRENPNKLLKKEDIIQDLKTRAAVSDFSPVKQIVLVRFTNTFWTRSWAEEDPNLSRWSWLYLLPSG